MAMVSKDISFNNYPQMTQIEKEYKQDENL
jgi:hypothetical protein